MRPIDKPGARTRVCFLFIGHHHQILHAAPVAAAMARDPGVEVHIAASTDAHLALIRRYLSALGGARAYLHRLWPSRSMDAGLPPKVLVLLNSLAFLSGFDAIVTPERTSLLLRKFGLTRPLFIHTDHGAGDRAVGYEKRIGEFDLTLLAGRKQQERMTDEGLLDGVGHAVVGYPKFDLADALNLDARPLFDEARPTVLYNPHFRRSLGSWPAFGWSVLEQFAASSDYNLIFAPHMRLFERGTRSELRRLEQFRGLPNMRIDLGSPQSCDMSYTNAADVYLGDVSSQVYEFIRRPRPCLFFNAHGVDWRGDRNYRHWDFGPVLHAAAGVVAQVEAAIAGRADYAPAQAAGFAHTFDLDGPSAERASNAILAFLAQARAAAPQAALLPGWGGGQLTPAEL